MIQLRITVVSIISLLCGYDSNGQIDSIYKTALSKADSAYEFKWSRHNDSPKDKGRFEVAKNLYKLASHLQPTESYPIHRIREIDNILNNLQSQPLLSTADTLFALDKFEEAKKLYLQADSLYSTAYTREKLDAIECLFGLTSADTHSILFIKYGSRFGECVGDCFRESKFTSKLTVEVRRAWEKNKPSKLETSKIDKVFWENILQATDLKNIYKLPHIIGCPDCTDAGAEWIEVGTANKSWKIEFDYGSEVPGIDSLLQVLRAHNLKK